MRFTRIVALFLTLALPCAAYSQQSKKPRPNSRTTAAPLTPRPRPSLSPAPPRMSPEKAFYYFVAMYGFGKVLRYGGPDDIIEIYGRSFDANNHKRAMADEFERNRYKERIRARIADEVRKIDFSEKFTFVVDATLGEYSFGSQSFPFVWFPESRNICISENSDANCRGALVEVSGFGVKAAVNVGDFNWSVPVSETDAGAFVKSRSTDGTAKLGRRIAVRITYSVVNKQGQESGKNFYYEYAHPIFSPFIYSVEVYTDESLTKKLGVIPKINSPRPSTAEEWRLATVAAQTPAKEIGKYRYIASYRDEHYRRPDTPIVGTITLTDVGVTLSGEQPEGISKMQSFSFFDSFATRLEYFKSHNYSNPVTSLWRANDVGSRDFRVTWDSFWQHHLDTALVFDSLQERNRFFVDLTTAIQDWATKYAQFAVTQLKIEQRCLVNTYFVPCSESAPFTVR